MKIDETEFLEQNSEIEDIFSSLNLENKSIVLKFSRFLKNEEEKNRQKELSGLDIINEQRLLKNISLLELSEDLKRRFFLEIDKSNLGRYFNGKVDKVDGKIVRGLCEILGLDWKIIFDKIFSLENPVTDPLVNDFSQYLKVFLEKEGLTLELFADKVGVSFGLVGHYINNRRLPSYKFFEKFFKAFDIEESEQSRLIQMVEKIKMPENLKALKD